MASGAKTSQRRFKTSPGLAPAVCVASVVAIWFVPNVLDGYYTFTTGLGLLTTALVVSYWLLLRASLVSLAHVTFFALGAYTAAVSLTRWHVPAVLAVIGGGLVAALAALLMGGPVMRTHGAYFLLVTFALMMVVDSALRQFDGVTGGVGGLAGVPSLGSTQADGFRILGLSCAGLIVIIYAVSRTRFGREIVAIGESTDLSSAVGIPVVRRRLEVFTLTASVAGVAGGLYAPYVNVITPASFGVSRSVDILVAAVIGGTSVIAGPLLGSALIVAIPEVFKEDPRLAALLTAAALLGVILLAPRGLVGHFQRVVGRNDIPVRIHAAEDFTLELPRRASRSYDTDPQPRVILQVISISKTFGGVRACDDITFDVHQGEILGVIGPNGAGKTTLFNVISGFLAPTSGLVLLRDVDLTHMAASSRVGQGLVRTFQAALVYQDVTVRENLTVASQAQRDGRGANVDTILDDFGLTHLADMRTRSLSYGTQKLLGVALAVACGPTVLCLDEPMAGLSRVEARSLARTIRVLADRGVTVMLIDHRVEVIAALCDRLVVLDFGVKIAEGSVDDVLADTRVRDAYLGEED